MKTTLFVTLLFCLPCFFTGAQSKEELTQLLLKKGLVTQAEIDSLKSETLPEPDTKKKSSFKPSIKASAVGHFAYLLEENNGVYNNSFNLVRVCGLINAEVMKNFRMVGLFYFAPKRIQHMHEFYFQWRPLKEIGLSGGLQKVPLSLGNMLSPANIETIDPSRIVREITGGAEDIVNGINTGRDLGLEIIGELFNTGTHYLLDYKVGMFNGRGAENLKDNDKYKDFVAWAFFQPVKGFRIGGSFLKTCTDIQNPNIINRTIYNASTEYDQKHFMVRAEYITAKDAPSDRWGAHLLGLWKACKWVDVVIAYDYFQKNLIDFTIEESHDIMGGFNLKFNRMCRLQTYYIHKRNIVSPVVNNNTFITQLQIGF